MESPREQALSRWLAHSHGVITARQAQGLGISPKVLGDLTRHGRLRRVHRGVYTEQPMRSTAAITASAAALAATEPHGVLSHRSAAWLWGLLPGPPARVDLLLPSGSRSRLDGVQIHRSVMPHAARSLEGLRVTDPATTVVDVAALAPGLVPAVVDRALSARLLLISHLEVLTRPEASHRRPGGARLRQHLHDRGHLGAPQPSVLESLMARRVFRDHGLPMPLVEVVAGSFGEYRLDYAYPERRLAVEVDGYVWHSSQEHMSADNIRRNRLRTTGWHLLVYTWFQVTRAPGTVAAEIRTNYDRLSGS